MRHKDVIEQIEQYKLDRSKQWINKWVHQLARYAHFPDGTRMQGGTGTGHPREYPPTIIDLVQMQDLLSEVNLHLPEALEHVGSFGWRAGFGVCRGGIQIHLPPNPHR